MDSVALQQIGDAVPSAMLVLDREARVVMANAAAVEMLGPGLTDRPFVTVLRHPAVVAAVPGGLPHRAAADGASGHGAE